jgi:hypothetical protein
LIQVYRALGGGWQIRCTGCEPTGQPLEVTLPPPPNLGSVPPHAKELAVGKNK